MKKNPTKCNSVSKLCYSLFIRSSTCFGRHTVHRQEPKTALAASGFSYIEGCWTCGWWTVPDNVHQPHVQQPSTYEKPEAASAVLGFWQRAVCLPKHAELHINREYRNFDTLLHLVGFFFMNCAMMHGSTNIKYSLFVYSGHLQWCLVKNMTVLWDGK